MILSALELALKHILGTTLDIILTDGNLAAHFHEKIVVSINKRIVRRQLFLWKKFGDVDSPGALRIDFVLFHALQRARLDVTGRTGVLDGAELAYRALLHD